MSLRIRLLGGLDIELDGVRVPDDAWTRRHAAALVKLLALAEGRRLHRERVIEALWPGLTVDAAAPRLHKAAHYARKALDDDPDAVVLRSDMVALLPGREVDVDVDAFLHAGRDALAAGAVAAGRALELYGGELLPEDPYEAWAAEPRAVVRGLYLDLLRLAGRWDELLLEEPADEEAHLAVASALADRGDVRGALRQLERMDQALRRELGTAPGPAARELRSRLEKSAPRSPPPARRGVRLVGRRDIGDQVRDRLEQASAGRGGTLVFVGAPGAGKSALLDLTEALAQQRGWRTGRGSASAVEGPWPYAPVLEALASLCRKHPALLDGLDDVYRTEIDRALSGREMMWSGESGHQRLFVAAAELVRLAATGHGLLLLVDDVHEADEASLRLLHYLSRCASTEQVLVAMAHRPALRETAKEVLNSLVGREACVRIEVLPLTESATRRLVAQHHPELGTAAIDHVWQVSAGVPFTALEVARKEASGQSGDIVPSLPTAVLRTFRSAALLGTTFSTDELVAVAEGSEEQALRHLDIALSALLVEPSDAGYRFRHPLVREALLDRMTQFEQLSARRLVAERLALLGAPPNQVAHHYLAARLPSKAVPYVLRAVETAGALGAYRDGLELVDAVRGHAGEEHLPRLLARRADLLMALGDPAAVAAYGEALPLTSGTDHRLVRARLARAATFAGDLDTSRAALAGIELEGDAADGPLLLARGNLAYFAGDIDTAWEIAGRARDLLNLADDEWHLVDLVSLQGLIAHQRGEWFERFRMEMRRTRGQDRLAIALFDAHLCVAEYLLYGPVPYAEVIAQADELRSRARRAGALRGIAFATALIGEAALLMGDVARAERELEESVELHRDIDASAGEAHSLQRLAEVRLLQGDREEAWRLLQRALPLARWSVISLHLLQRVYGTMIAAASDLEAARTVVDQAEATFGETDRCPFCDVMLAVPATIACADVGDLDGARRHLAAAEASAVRWAGTAWEAGALEARAHVMLGEADPGTAEGLLVRAAAVYENAGHRMEAERCRRTRALALAPVVMQVDAGTGTTS